MPTATMSTQGRITIPVEIRKALRLRKGDRVQFVLDVAGNCRIVARNRDVRQLKGLVDLPAKRVSLERIKRTNLSAAATRFIGSDKSP